MVLHRQVGNLTSCIETHITTILTNEGHVMVHKEVIRVLLDRLV